MTVNDLMTDLKRDLNYATDPGVIVTDRLMAHLQKAHLAILREPSLSRLRDSLQPLTFASVANQAVYGLPSQLSRVYAVTERDNDRDLQFMSLTEMRAADPGMTATGTPWAFVPMSYGPLKATVNTTGIWVASSDAADTSQQALVDGVLSGGLPTGPITATLNGVTRVQVGTATTFVDVQSISLSSTCAGVVTFYDAAVAGNTLAEIAIGKSYPKYFRVQLYPTPEAVITYYVDGQFNVPALDNTSDIPMVPEEFHDLLAAYARIREYERTGDRERMGVAAAEWSTGLGRLKFMVSSSPAETLTMGRPRRRLFSRFGAWTPADSGWNW